MGTNYRGRQSRYGTQSSGWSPGKAGRPPDHSRSIHVHRTADTGIDRWQWASPEQEAFFKYGPAPCVASGGFGAGKTLAAARKVLYLSDMYPGNRGVVARRVWDELKKTTMSTFFKIIPPEAYSFGGRRADSDKILRFNNGSEILWLHMDDPETENVIRGIEINWFLLDQGEENEEEIFDKLSSRLGRWDRATVPQWMVDREEAEGRSWPWRDPVTGRPLPPTYAMMTCNPDHLFHWIYRRFHPDSEEHWERKIPVIEEMRDTLPEGVRHLPFVSYHDMGYRMFTFDSRNNRFLPKQNLSTMLQKDESFIRRFVKGEWGIPEGTIHKVPAECLISPDAVINESNAISRVSIPIVDWIRAHCELHRVLDHGDTSPTCCLWYATDREGNIFFYREYYRPDALISDHRQEITAMSEGEKYVFNLADPSIFHLTMQKFGGRWSVADEYKDGRVHPLTTALYWQPADNNEHGTRDRISQLLKVDPNRIHPITKERGSPRVFFIRRSTSYPNGCWHTIRELSAQKRTKIGTEMGKPIFNDDRDKNVPDHAYDCVRYAVASRPPAVIDKRPAPPPGSMDAIWAQELKFRKSHGYERMERQYRRALRRAGR